MLLSGLPSSKETKMTRHLDGFLSDWAGAERAGDAERLALLLADDFCGIGPLGFVLPRSEWLDRHRQGLAYEAFDLDEIQVHCYGDLVLVTARNTTRGTYQGQPLPEAVRVTLVVAAESETLRLASIHMSFIAGTSGSPPLLAAATPARRGIYPERGSGKDHTHADGEGR
jgi:ketosteroid isomerase-like protein